jgi:hypothetical protein
MSIIAFLQIILLYFCFKEIFPIKIPLSITHVSYYCLESKVLIFVLISFGCTIFCPKIPGLYNFFVNLKLFKFMQFLLQAKPNSDSK